MTHQEQDAYCSFYSASVCICVSVYGHTVCVRDDCVKVLPHCLDSVSIASMCISVFFTDLLSFNNRPRDLYGPLPWVTTAAVIILICVIVKHVVTETQHLHDYVVSHSMYMWDLLPPAFLHCVCSVESIFIGSVGRFAFCWLCMVQSLGLVLINSIWDPPQLCAADWLYGSHSLTVESYMSKSMSHLCNTIWTAL